MKHNDASQFYMFLYKYIYILIYILDSPFHRYLNPLHMIGTVAPFLNITSYVFRMSKVTVPAAFT